MKIWAFCNFVCLCWDTFPYKLLNLENAKIQDLSGRSTTF